MARAFEVPAVAAPIEEVTESRSARSASWNQELRDLRPLQDTCAVSYLNKRSLRASIAHQSGVRFASNFMGRPAVVFPLRARNGELRGAHARYIDGCDKPKARTLGDKRAALFVTHGALDAKLPALIVTEAPLDALSLAEAGYPAVALCGTQAPTWLHRACAFRRVMLALDADEAGDHAALELAPLLSSFGARCERMRPEGAKDWNELLGRVGRDALADWLAARVLID
jgi:DNA primase